MFVVIRLIFGKSPALAGAKHHDGYAHENNKIEKGDILFQSNELTLMVPENIDFAKQPVYRQVYRYGYNMNTGEIFIPTSDNLVYDASTLQGAGSAYQVCDIDLSGISWTPKSYYSGVYDGGGHAIKNLLINKELLQLIIVMEWVIKDSVCWLHRR